MRDLATLTKSSTNVQPGTPPAFGPPSDGALPVVVSRLHASTAPSFLRAPISRDWVTESRPRSQVCALQWSRHEKEILSSHGFSQNQLCLWKYPSMAKIAEFSVSFRIASSQTLPALH